MICGPCFLRRRLALDLWPQRRPLYRPCATCRVVATVLALAVRT